VKRRVLSTTTELGWVTLVLGEIEQNYDIDFIGGAYSRHHGKRPVTALNEAKAGGKKKGRTGNRTINTGKGSKRRSPVVSGRCFGVRSLAPLWEAKPEWMFGGKTGEHST